MFSKLKGLEVIATQVVLPKGKKYNADSSSMSDIDKKRLIEHTGIDKRFIASPDDNILPYFEKAVSTLMDRLTWKNDVDAIIVVTQNTVNHIPPIACKIQGNLNFTESCAAFDMNLGCSGFIYGLHAVGNLLQSTGRAKGRAILCCGDLSSQLIDNNDPSTEPIFSDGVCAIALEYDSISKSEMHFCLETHGVHQHAISSQMINGKQKMTLHGMEVFHAALSFVPSQIKRLLAESGQKVNNIDQWFFHQANLMINESIINDLNLPKQSVPNSIQSFGNTAIASIPITMNEFLKDSPQKIICCGFGVGFSVASVILDSERFNGFDIIYV